MTEQVASPHFYPCTGCGARVEYAPGTQALRCPYCGYEQQLAATEQVVREHAIEELATLPRKPAASVGAYTLRCTTCGASIESDALAQRCQFCGSSLVIEPHAGDLIAPEAVLPFAIDQPAMRESLGKWVASRWFAPSRLKTVTEAETTRGTYLPHWTFDADTMSYYTGQRGEHYYVTETYTTTVDGETRTETRQVQKTAWYPTSGTVERSFDDVLVTGSQRLTDKQLDSLAPWQLEDTSPYRPEYLSGYDALRYDTEPETGLDVAKGKMAPVIEQDCRNDIGGDEQQVHSVDTRYSAVTYKLVLLPVWIAMYLYAGKTWQVLINGQTGKVVGQRPYSVIKIVFAVLVAIVVLAVLFGLYALSHHHR